MKTLKPFFKAVLESFNPNAYRHLSVRSFPEAFHYFLSVLLMSFFVLIVLSLPMLATVPTRISLELSKFDKFKMDADIEMSDPIVVGEDFAVDTTGEILNRTTERVLVTNDTLYTKWIWKANEDKLEDLYDLTKNKDRFGRFIWMGIILLMPGVIMLVFFGAMLKYLFIIFLCGLIAFVVTRAMKLDTKVKHLLKIGLYAATPMIIADILVSRFIPVWWLGDYIIPYGLFGFYFVIGIALNSEKKIKHKGEDFA